MISIANEVKFPSLRSPSECLRDQILQNSAKSLTIMTTLKGVFSCLSNLLRRSKLTMLTKPAVRRPFPVTTTLMFSGLRDGSHRRKACRGQGTAKQSDDSSQCIDSVLSGDQVSHSLKTHSLSTFSCICQTWPSLPASSPLLPLHYVLTGLSPVSRPLTCL